jgi:hypothetical protein
VYILRVASATLDRSPLYVRAREPKQLLKSEENLSKLRRRANALAVARHGIAVLASAQEDSMKRIITIVLFSPVALSSLPLSLTSCVRNRRRYLPARDVCGFRLG